MTAILLGAKTEAVELHWRPLGNGGFVKIPLLHVARGVYKAELPTAAMKADFEYYVKTAVGGKILLYPATAPVMNQTVVVCE